MMRENLIRTRWARQLVDRLTRKGRTVATTSIGGFLQLRLVAAFKPWRRGSLRFRREQVSLAAWLQSVIRIAAQDQELATEVAAARGLVKGYGDTHERGSAKFETLMSVAPRLAGFPDAAARLVIVGRFNFVLEILHALLKLDDALAHGAGHARQPAAEEHHGDKPNNEQFLCTYAEHANSPHPWARASLNL